MNEIEDEPGLVEVLSQLNPEAAAQYKRFDRYLSVAEEEIAKAFADPHSADARVCFRACCPNPIFYGKTEEVYRAHVREMAKRVQERTPKFEEPTGAELICILSGASLSAPLSKPYSMLYERLLHEHLPETTRRLEPSDRKEDWPGELDEIERALRRRFKRPRG